MSKNRILQEKIKIEKELYKSTLSSIKAQMNPHFLFNALNTIQSFIYTNDRKTASSYLVSFSELTRMILDMSNRELVSLSEEITALNLYLKLEKMRFEDDFSYVMNTENLPHQNFQIPSMLIQPYVENAIKHGLLHKKGERKLEIRFEYIQSILNVQIEDNGIGIEASQKLNKSKNQKHESFSTHANQKRFEILNQMNQQHIGVEIITIKNEDNSVKGTLVSLSIPVN
jgi:LytS/YehU family sensor histidine kinase